MLLVNFIIRRPKPEFNFIHPVCLLASEKSHECQAGPYHGRSIHEQSEATDGEHDHGCWLRHLVRVFTVLDVQFERLLEIHGHLVVFDAIEAYFCVSHVDPASKRANRDYFCEAVCNDCHIFGDIT